jgi:hypothetical protein
MLLQLPLRDCVNPASPPTAQRLLVASNNRLLSTWLMVSAQPCLNDVQTFSPATENMEYLSPATNTLKERVMLALSSVNSAVFASVFGLCYPSG